MRPAPHAVIRAAGLALSTAVVLAACTGSNNGSDEGGSSTTPAEPSTSSTAAPVLLAVVPNLALAPEQCFADVDSIVATPTTVAPDPPTETTGAEGQTTGSDPTTEPTSPDTLPETTVVPRPAAIAVVDCGGTHSGQVFAAFCLGTDEDSDGKLTAVACPGAVDLTYPGDRNIRRAAARICLQRFEETFGESYASSARVAQEFTPTEGVWGLGDHRVVCHATPPEIE